MGKVILVGAGPGDYELITIKGKRYIENADCIIYDRLIAEELLSMAKDGCETIYVGKENHNHTMPQDEINQLLLDKSNEHRMVVRLKGGDPYIFGRGGEEASFLVNNDVDVEVVPGISSAIAVLTYAGIPATYRGVAKGIHIVTSHSKTDTLSDIDFSLYSDKNETCIFLMGLSHVKEIANGLIGAGRDEQTPAAVISNGTKNSQTKCVGILKNIAGLAEESGMMSPAIIVVGDVINYESELSFFEKRKLFGQKFVVPYISGIDFDFSDGLKHYEDNKLIRSLRLIGAEVIAIKVGKIEPVACDVVPMSDGDIIVFTSKNAVASFMWNLKAQSKDIRVLGGAKIAVVGEKTAETLSRYGIVADIVAEGKTSLQLANKILSIVDSNTNVVWYCAKEKSQDIPRVLAEKCKLQEKCCYENVDLSRTLTLAMREEISDCDGAIFTSVSSARRLLKATDGNIPSTVYSIGPTCSRYLSTEGILGVKEADMPSHDSLIELILDCMASEKE